MSEKITAHAGLINGARFQALVRMYLDEYSQDLVKTVEIAVNETAEQVVDELHTAGTFKGKKYRNSWTFRNATTSTQVGVTVFNKKHYRLAHLLEFGHANRNGGRTKAYPHIAPINDRVPEIFAQRMEAMLGGGWDRAL